MKNPACKGGSSFRGQHFDINNRLPQFLVDTYDELNPAIKVANRLTKEAKEKTIKARFDNYCKYHCNYIILVVFLKYEGISLGFGEE